MEVRRFDDAAAWLDVVGPLLEEDEPRHNIHFGLATTLTKNPDVYPTKHLWAVVDGDRIVGAALQTPPYNLLVARPAGEGVVRALAGGIHVAGVLLPGVMAAVPEVQAFADAWCVLAGTRSRQVMSQGIYALRQVHDIAAAPGRPRAASLDDLDRVLSWDEAFVQEVVPQERGEASARRRRIGTAVRSDHAGFWLWEDDAHPVSMTGFSRSTPNGCRIGPVYTPPGFRGRGYATSLVEHVSRDELARGRRMCFLYTDMANPTSNAIYQRIGYELVCGSEELSFEPA